MVTDSWCEVVRDETKGLRLALVGEPVEGSPLPTIARAALKEMGVVGSYDAFLVPTEEFGECVSHLARAGYRGVNVTPSHKALAAKTAERFFEAKHSVGVANTLLFEDGIYGRNTDVPAFMSQIANVTPTTALLLGAGAGARAVAMGLLLGGWKIRVWNRGAHKARLLATYLRSRGQVDVIPEANPSGCTLIVNATKIGARAGEEPPVLWKNAIRNTIAFDLVFRKVATEFLRSASTRGFKTIDGREMLVEQTALSLEWWTGRSVPREPMRIAAGLPSA